MSGTAYLGTVLSGTRSWAFILSLIVVLVALTGGRSFWRLVATGATLLALALVVGQARPEYRERISPSMQRIGELEMAAGGEIRPSTRPRIACRGWRRSSVRLRRAPFLGGAFPLWGLETFDNDLGFVNTVLLVGVVGSMLCGLPLLGCKEAESRRPNGYHAGDERSGGPSPGNVGGWIGLLVGYLTIHDLFTWYCQNISFVALFIALCDFYLKGP